MTCGIPLLLGPLSAPNATPLLRFHSTRVPLALAAQADAQSGFGLPVGACTPLPLLLPIRFRKVECKR